MLQTLRRGTGTKDWGVWEVSTSWSLFQWILKVYNLEPRGKKGKFQLFQEWLGQNRHCVQNMRYI